MFGLWTEPAEMGRFVREKDVLDFWLGGKQDVVLIEWRNNQTNWKEWLHKY